MVPTFLRKSKVGQTVAWRCWEVDGCEAQKWQKASEGGAPREIVSFISFFLVRLSIFLGNSGEQESGEPLYDGGVPHGFAKDY